MIKEELNELYWLNKEIEDLNNRLKELDNISISSSKISNQIKSNNGNNSIVERLALKKIELQNKIYENMILILSEKQKIEKFIETIPDSQIRTIIRLRNIDLMSWENIGRFMDLDRKTVSLKYNKFIKDINKKIKDKSVDKKITQNSH